MNLTQFILPAVCAGVLSAAFSYCFARYSGRLQLLAKPRPDRWHEMPTPNTGGVGILIGCAVAYLLFAGAGYWIVAACAGLVSLLGFVDDRLQLPPMAKLAGQAAAAAVVITSGTTLHWTPSPWVNVIITALWIIGITNAFNLIDNMDGLCAGVAAIVAASGAALSLLQQDGQRTLPLTIVAAACLGFLIFNHKPAKIFMGDCGSMFIGFSLASLAATSPRQGDSILESWYALPAFLYPIFDTTLVSVLRRANGRPISVGGRDHSSHRLVFTGLSEQKAVWTLWGVAAVCAACGPLVYHRPGWFLFLMASLLTALTAFGTFLALLPGFAPHTQARSIDPMLQSLRRGRRAEPAPIALLATAEPDVDDAPVYEQAGDRAG